MKAARFRVARPTDNIDRLRTFYVDGLGLATRGEFLDHDGYDGLILGPPDASYEIEFTQNVDGSPCRAPSKDNLLVFYLGDSTEVQAMAERLGRLGIEPVKPENPYWAGRGLTFEDADGWRVVLVDSEALAPV